MFMVEFLKIESEQELSLCWHHMIGPKNVKYLVRYQGEWMVAECTQEKKKGDPFYFNTFLARSQQFGDFEAVYDLP